MASALYRLMITSDARPDLIYVRQVRARDLAEAEIAAVARIQWLRRSDPARSLWDRWDLGARTAGTRGWVALAQGTHDGTQWSARHALERLKRHGRQ